MNKFHGPYSSTRLNTDSAAEVPGVPGVYLWRRIFNPPDGCGACLECIGEFLATQASIPLAVFSQTRLARHGGVTGIRNGFVLLEKLAIGSALIDAKALTPDSQEEAEWLADVAERSMRLQFGPVLYVGQSANLRQRIQQHLAGESGLQERLNDCGLSMRDVALYFMESPTGSSESARIRLEVLLTHLTGAPFTRRAG